MSVHVGRGWGHCMHVHMRAMHMQQQALQLCEAAGGMTHITAAVVLRTAHGTQSLLCAYTTITAVCVQGEVGQRQQGGG